MLLVEVNGLIMKWRGVMQNPGRGGFNGFALSSAQKLFSLSI
jgi:hypothetical protein